MAVQDDQVTPPSLGIARRMRSTGFVVDRRCLRCRGMTLHSKSVILRAPKSPITINTSGYDIPDFLGSRAPTAGAAAAPSSLTVAPPTCIYGRTGCAERAPAARLGRLRRPSLDPDDG